MRPGASATCPPSASRPPTPPSAPLSGAPTPPRPPMLALVVPWCRAAVEQGPYSLPVGRTRPDCSARAPGRLMKFTGTGRRICTRAVHAGRSFFVE
eukprot:4138801-Prymnesium_polylepis.1